MTMMLVLKSILFLFSMLIIITIKINCTDNHYMFVNAFMINSNIHHISNKITNCVPLTTKQQYPILLLQQQQQQRQEQRIPRFDCNSLSKIQHVQLPTHKLFSSNTEGDNSSDERLKWLDKATQLRRDIELLEQKQQQVRGTSTTSSSSSQQLQQQQQQQQQQVIEITDIADSIWTLSYRFSDQPEQQEDNNNSNDNDTNVRNFYSGKVTIKFRKDGYTDIISQSPGVISSSSTGSATILKAWGWDIERGNDDNNNDDTDNEYIVFSLDVQLPNAVNNNNKNSNEKQRFYFQARQVQQLPVVSNSANKNNKGSIISFDDGTITIKQDLVDAKKIPKRFGFFSNSGILAQFRYVGNFIIKPSA